jgi:hypothetical protein
MFAGSRKKTDLCEMKIQLTGEEKEALCRYRRITAGIPCIKVICILMPSDRRLNWNIK